MSRILIISNRLPVKITAQNGEFLIQQSEGGLATGLGSIYGEKNTVWLGWPGICVEEEAQRKEITNHLAEKKLHPVFLTQEEINLYYEGFSNEILWPVFHYMATYARFENTYWESYVSVNRKFCEAAMKIYQPGDIIWVHDYQLLLLPRMIRLEKSASVIGYFQHIPFPSFELYRLLPWRTELLEGLLGANLLGFHTYDDARHFLSACSRLLNTQSTFSTIGYQERNIVAEAFPMGIDDRRFTALTNDLSVQAHLKQLQKDFQHTRLILSIDRLDYSKGILQRLQAFDLLLHQYPEWRGKVSLYMIVVPSRDTVPLYKDLRDEIDKLAGNINARYSTNSWLPINYFYRSFPVEMLSALYQQADVCLVTPLRDGMNLVCKEFVASRVKNTGVLILSEMAGASKELVDAIIVNPNNSIEICNAMRTALTMPPEEQYRRMKQMRDLVNRYPVSHWADIFMKRLLDVTGKKEQRNARQIGLLTQQYIRNRYIKARKRLILLDYDGTLVRFFANIHAAFPDEGLLDILEELTNDAKNKVAIISGRQHTTLEEWLGNRDMDLVAEHGMWEKKDNGNWEETAKITSDWKAELLPILQSYTGRTSGSFIEEKSHSLAWHYRNAEKELGEYRANELVSHLRYFLADMPLNVLSGNKVIEIKSTEVNKGKAIAGYLEDNRYDFILAIGDDATDEDMFRAIGEKGISVKVGSNRTAAYFCLDTIDDAKALLKYLPARFFLTRMLDNVMKYLPYPSLMKFKK
ncbi:MAG: bifunctional alpha,alpha-trehalose-phosphate synthase (UDP-forming)/trehalose-phosphatase [Bacteroidota bacterium]